MTETVFGERRETVEALPRVFSRSLRQRAWPVTGRFLASWIRSHRSSEQPKAGAAVNLDVLLGFRV